MVPRSLLDRACLVFSDGLLAVLLVFLIALIGEDQFILIFCSSTDDQRIQRTIDDVVYHIKRKYLLINQNSFKYVYSDHFIHVLATMYHLYYQKVSVEYSRESQQRGRVV